MAYPQEIVPATTITRAENRLLELCTDIFNARNFKDVEETIWRASKIWMGLEALSYVVVGSVAYQEIIIGLNQLCIIYNDHLLT